MSSSRSDLITGIGGFLGSHLAELLLAEGHAVSGTVHRDTRNIARVQDKLCIRAWDLSRRAQIVAVVEEVRPQVVYHLAAQSLPVLSWRRPSLTFRSNVLGTLNLLDALRKGSPQATTVMAGSSAEYGIADEGEVPIREEKPLRPLSPYGVSKAAADLLARLYARVHGMKIVRARLFFVTGPRKTGDACSDFARGIVAVEKGRTLSVRVGNLEAVRDFLDVRDAARALVLLAERGTPGEAYNVCSGRGRRVAEALEHLLSMAVRPISVEEDADRLRPADEPAVVGDNSRLRALGWQPNIPLEQTLADMLAYWRGMEGAETGGKRDVSAGEGRG